MQITDIPLSLLMQCRPAAGPPRRASTAPRGTVRPDAASSVVPSSSSKTGRASSCDAPPRTGRVLFRNLCRQLRAARLGGRVQAHIR